MPRGFPQVVSVQGNPSARALLQRDVEKLVQYFGRFCATPEPSRLSEGLWRRYGGRG